MGLQFMNFLHMPIFEGSVCVDEKKERQLDQDLERNKSKCRADRKNKVGGKKDVANSLNLALGRTFRILYMCVRVNKKMLTFLRLETMLYTSCFSHEI